MTETLPGHDRHRGAFRSKRKCSSPHCPSLRFCMACCLLFRVQSLFGFCDDATLTEPFYIPWDEKIFTNYSINLQFSIFSAILLIFLLTSVSLLRFHKSSLPMPSTQAKRAGWVGDHITS